MTTHQQLATWYEPINVYQILLITITRYLTTNTLAGFCVG